MNLPVKKKDGFGFLKFVLNQGVSIFIVIVVSYISIRYFEIQMENTKAEMERKLELKQWKLSGTMEKKKLENEDFYQIDFILQEK